MRTDGFPRLLAGAWLLGARACGSNHPNTGESPDTIAEPMQRTISLCTELADTELGETEITKFTSVILRLPSASHDVEVRFSDSGAVTCASAIHKPLQR